MTTMREPEWDEETRDAALGLDLYEDSLCSLCGRPTYVCQDASRQDYWKPLQPVRCHATTAVLAKQAGFTEETNPQVGALLFGAELIESEASRG